MSEETRVAIVNKDKCKPKKCVLECKRGCPINRGGKRCIEVTPEDKLAVIRENMCIGCGICVKKCPFVAITIINIPSDLEKHTIHRFGVNTFKLHRLPYPRPGEVLGLVGTNGIGKSTAIRILAGKVKPNLGRYNDPPDWHEILNYFRGSELQNYFRKIIEDDLKVSIKPQHTDLVLRVVGEKLVGDVLKSKDKRGIMDELCKKLDLSHLLDRLCNQLSGGELQRFCIACAAANEVDVYFFDEPSSYLDVKQRLAAAHVIRETIQETNYVVAIEHDLSVLDYLSDFICCLYGTPCVYGVVTVPFSVREGINVFLDGYIEPLNLRFREEPLKFKIAENAADFEIKRSNSVKYPFMSVTLDNFHLSIDEGVFSNSEIIVMLGENGTGKTTFINLLAGRLKPNEDAISLPTLNISHKPQTLKGTREITVRNFLLEKIQQSYMHPQFQSDVVKPMKIEEIGDQQIKNLSGGELQRVALTVCLGKPADVYLIDEPSANLDSEQRIAAAKVIKRFILHAKKTAFVVEHDFIMATYLADRVIVFEGIPGRDTKANTPQSLLTGMNKFLKSLDITFRRDPNNFRPRINKLNSVKDTEQKRSNNYFYLDEA